MYPDNLPPGESIHLEINRQKAEAMGLSFASVSSTLSAAMGSLYVNDFPNGGHMQQVILQADASARMQLDDVLGLRMRNASGGMVPLREVVTPEWHESPQQMMRFDGFPAVRIAGGAAPGISSGAAMAEMERLAAQLPLGFALAWTGQSLQERQSAEQAPLLMLLSALVVFLVLAALYESWSIPLSVMLVVPLGLLGAVAAVMLRGMPNDVFFKVGMITIIGLSAKNAILIVEFARQLHSEGRSLLDAAVTAACLRLRPHSDDIAGLHPRGGALDARQWRQRRDPARHRHRRVRRHDQRHPAGHLLRTGLLRLHHRHPGSAFRPGGYGEHLTAFIRDR